MRLKSEVFYVPLADIFPRFHDVIMNYKEESETVRENGLSKTFNFTRLPYMFLNRFAAYANYVGSLATLPSSNLTYDEKAWLHTYFQQLAIDRLTHQIGIPFDICCARVTSSPTLADMQDNPYCANNRYLDTTSTVSGKWNITLSGAVPVSLLPFQATNMSIIGIIAIQFVVRRLIFIQIYLMVILVVVGPWVASYDRTTPSYALSTNNNVNRFFNSLFQIRKRFYRKDYFNTAVGDPTVGVDSISVPDNIVDLRKANRLQQFIEKASFSGQSHC